MQQVNKMQKEAVKKGVLEKATEKTVENVEIYLKTR